MRLLAGRADRRRLPREGRDRRARSTGISSPSRAACPARSGSETRCARQRPEETVPEAQARGAICAAPAVVRAQGLRRGLRGDGALTCRRPRRVPGGERELPPARVVRDRHLITSRGPARRSSGRSAASTRSARRGPRRRRAQASSPRRKPPARGGASEDDEAGGHGSTSSPAPAPPSSRLTRDAELAARVGVRGCLGPDDRASQATAGAAEPSRQKFITYSGRWAALRSGCDDQCFSCRVSARVARRHARDTAHPAVGGAAVSPATATEVAAVALPSQRPSANGSCAEPSSTFASARRARAAIFSPSV